MTEVGFESSALTYDMYLALKKQLKSIRLKPIGGEVQIEMIEGERSVILQLRVHPDDIGKVIGKQGRIAQALRTLVKAAATKQGKNAIVEILD